MVKVIDNYLTKSYHKEIQERLTNTDFPWYYSSNVSTTVDSSQFNAYGFSQSFWENDAKIGAELDSDYFQRIFENFNSKNFATFIKPFLLQVMDTIDCDMILRCRSDMVTWAPKEFIHQAHVDYLFPNTATIFYVNDTDGDTFLYGKHSFVKDIKIDQDRFGTLSQTVGTKTTTLEIKERISPKANRLIVFDGDLLHTGSSPTQHKTRILLNSNFRKK